MYRERERGEGHHPYLETFRTFVYRDSVLLQQLVTAVTLTVTSFTGGNILQREIMLGCQLSAQLRWRSYYEGSHGEEMVVTPGEVRSADQREATAPALYWQLAVLG